jgi:PHD-finger
MAPHLRSSSRATSNNSRPSTPTATLPSTEYTFSDSSRPRKQRRTGRNSRVGVESVDDSREATTEPQSLSISDIPRILKEKNEQANQRRTSGRISIDQLVASSEWPEPALREAQPSYKDYTWSNAWYGQNVALSSMRPLGQPPTAADKRKAGLKTPKPIKEVIKDTHSTKKVSKKGASHDNATNGNGVPANASDPSSLPSFTSSEYDVEKLRSVVQTAIRVADEAGNRAVSQGLRRLWEQGTNDAFVLSILDSVMRKNPDAEQMAAFKTVMRHAFKENASSTQTAEPEPISRSLSTASDSSLSSAKSTDLRSGKTTAARNENGRGAVTRGRKRARDSEVLPAPVSNLDDVSGQKRHIDEVYDEDEEEDAASVAKRTRRDNFPTITKQSQIRSSLGRDSPVRSSTYRTRNKVSKAGIDQASGDPATSENESSDNNDFCRQCRGNGSLLCCDGCINSYHFSCLEPPLDPANLPEGQWFCPSCQMRNSFGSLVKNIGDGEQDFQLPTHIREHYQGVQTGKGGVYQQVAANLRSGTRGRGRREGKAEQEYLTRLYDAKGKLIVCIACGLTSNGTRPMIQCDFCPCWWHIDCTDPPLPGPPRQQQASDKTYHNWMCPNHIDHELYTVNFENGTYAGKTRIRRPRNPRVIDVDVLPDDEEVEELQETESQGIVYRVSESGLKLNFIERVKRENLEARIHASGAAQYRDYATRKLDELVEKATAFYESAAPAEQPSPEADAQASILASRSPADREAIANLVSFATENRDAQEAIPSDKINYLVDALLASSPDGAPHASTELQSLEALKELINRRIGALQSSE